MIQPYPPSGGVGIYPVSEDSVALLSPEACLCFRFSNSVGISRSVVGGFLGVIVSAGYGVILKGILLTSVGGRGCGDDGQQGIA